MIQVKQFFAFNELRNYSYLLYDDSTGEAWAIDPYDSLMFIKYIKENSLSLQGILNTHSHFDHIRGNAPLEEAFHAPVKKLQNREKIELSTKSELVTLDTPGHTMDHQVFVLKDGGKERALFSGDTLFNAGVGNCKNGGNVDLLYETTMNLVRILPEDILLFPGHDYAERNLAFAATLEPENRWIQEELKEAKDASATDRRTRRLKEEKQVNPFFRLTSEEIRGNFTQELKPLDDEKALERHLFHKLRSLRDKW